MIENIIMSESIKGKINIDQFDHHESLSVHTLNCKDNVMFVTFIYEGNLKIQKKYNIKSIYIKEDNYIFKEKLQFNFFSLEINNELELMTICIDANIFWGNLNHVEN